MPVYAEIIDENVNFQGEQMKQIMVAHFKNDPYGITPVPDPMMMFLISYNNKNIVIPASIGQMGFDRDLMYWDNRELGVNLRTYL
jgi:hypothetical protein